MRRSFRKFFTTNRLLKLTSLVLAMVLWFFIVSQGRSVIDMDVPIVFKNLPDNLEVLDGPKTIDIGIEGQERLLKKLRREDIAVVIDLNNVKKGSMFFPLTADNVILPNMYTITDISPQTVKLRIEGKVTKRVPVRTVIVGSPAPGFALKGIEVVPVTITIRGTESVVTKIYSVKTEPIDVTGVASNFQYRAFVDIGKNSIKVDPTEVEVTIDVKPKR